jgi:ribonuclease III
MTTQTPLDWAEAALEHRFRNPDLLEQALSHSSLKGPSYERLEFLGDRVLGLVIGAWLYQHYPQESEGRLGRRLAEIVRLEACADVARAIGVAEHIRVERSAALAGVQQRTTVLGDVCEALIGALFLDGGLVAARRFIKTHWRGLVEAAQSAVKDPKSALQEWAMGRGQAAPLYEILDRSGPDHAPMFKVRVSVKGQPAQEGEGRTKQEAQKIAAAALLEKLA